MKLSRPVRILLGVSLFLVAMGLTTCASAQRLELDAPGDLDLTQPNELTLGGAVGVWFPMATARSMLGDLRELQIRQDVGSRLANEERLVWEQRRILTDQQAVMVAEARRTHEALVLALRERLTAAEASRDHWSRSRALWLLLGAILGGGVVVAAVVAS